MLREVLFGLLLVAGLSTTTAQAADPATLTLACKGTEAHRGGAGRTSEIINIGVVIDFQKKTVTGLSDSLVKINGVDETTISFSGGDTGWFMTGSIDRVTGWLHAASDKSDPITHKTILSISYDLTCTPTQRMF